MALLKEINNSDRDILYMFKYFLNSVIALAVAVIISGCEGGGDSNSGPYGDTDYISSSSSSNNSTDIVGTWSLTENGTGNIWYIHFFSDGNWKITDDAAGTQQRVFGTYTHSGNEFQGPMQNPGVGEGKIGGSITNGGMVLYFREFWHTPHKIVEYSGYKMK